MAGDGDKCDRGKDTDPITQDIPHLIGTTLLVVNAGRMSKGIRRVSQWHDYSVKEVRQKGKCGPEGRGEDGPPVTLYGCINHGSACEAESNAGKHLADPGPLWR